MRATLTSGSLFNCSNSVGIVLSKIDTNYGVLGLPVYECLGNADPERCIQPYCYDYPKLTHAIKARKVNVTVENPITFRELEIEYRRWKLCGVQKKA